MSSYSGTKSTDQTAPISYKIELCNSAISHDCFYIKILAIVNTLASQSGKEIT